MTDTKLLGGPKQDEKLNLDRILAEEIGEGKYQLMAIALCAIVAFFHGWTSHEYIFYAERVKTRCRIPECDDNDQFGFSPPWLANAIPQFGHRIDNCHRFAPSNTWNVSADLPVCPSKVFDNSSIVGCTEYVYQHQNSAVYEFGLACDEWRWFLFGSSQLVGRMISLPLMGFVSDRWGRRLALSITAFSYAWINATRYWADSYNVFILLGFLGSVFGAACNSCAVTLALELVGTKRRMAVGCVVTAFVNTGSVVKGLVAWTQPYWRNLILIIYVPMLMNLSYFWIAPESIRWLINKNRFEEAKISLSKAAKMNGRVLSDETAKQLAKGIKKSKVKVSEANLIGLMLKYKTILLRCIIISTWSLASTLVIKGLAISSLSISGNKYLNYCAVNVIAIFGYWAVALIINKIGRKPLLTCLFWMSGTCQLGYIFLANGSHGLNLALYLVTKFCAAAVHVLIDVYTAELFPTSHRSRLSMFTSMFGQCGGLLAVLTPALADRVWEHLPHALFSLMAITAGLLALLIPETRGTTLPETMEDAVNLGKKSSSRVPKSRITIKDSACKNGDIVLGMLP